MFHKFKNDVSVIEPPQRFNNPFYYKPHKLCELAAEEVRSMLQTSEEWMADASKGKMFGVLVVRNNAGEIGFLAGFSGLLCGSNKQKGFVPPIFDFMAPAGYFKCEEHRISEINAKISAIKNSQEYADACAAAHLAQKDAFSALEQRKAEYADNKKARALRRASDALTPDEEALLVRNSQFEKAELKRLAKHLQATVDVKRADVKLFEERLATLATERKSRSAALQEWLFAQFKVYNARGECSPLLDIFATYTGTLPPAGAGECAAPKMLQYAYEKNLTPLSMAEFWVGASPVGEVRRDGCFYGSCKSKCHPILSFMLQGVDVEESALERGGDNVCDTKIIFEDDYIIVVEKPQGVLSVPGIVGGGSVQDWLRATRASNDIFVAHRLDMATSGLLVAAKSVEVFKLLQRKFAAREVEKKYTALLSGRPALLEGEVNLPLAPDYDNRPRQKVCFEQGKPAKTSFKLLREVVCDGKICSLCALMPVTGRTHQLRVHCAHSKGLDTPIVGDALYGSPAERLMLNASYLSFAHPVTGERMEFSCSAAFESL